MSERNDGGQAFPATPTMCGDGMIYPDPGMSLRDWFAGQAMAAIIVGNGADATAMTPGAAKDAYIVADAMLAERSRK